MWGIIASSWAGLPSHVVKQLRSRALVAFQHKERQYSNKATSSARLCDFSRLTDACFGVFVFFPADGDHVIARLARG